MKVILKEPVPKLGQKWDVKNVAAGYARNFLFPRKLAELATPDLLERSKKERERKDAVVAERLQDMMSLVSKLDGMELQIFAKADEGGTLFGSVGEQEIRRALRNHNVSLNNTPFTIKEPIKSLGEHDIALEFANGLEAHVKITVEKEE